MLERSGQQLKEIGASQFWFHTRKDAAHALETFEIDMKQLESWRTELIARLERAAPNY